MIATDHEGVENSGVGRGRDIRDEKGTKASREPSTVGSRLPVAAQEGADDQPLEDDRSAAPSLRAFLAQQQRAEVSLMVGRNAGFKAKAEITNGGLLSIAALVSSILLTTTVLVHVAVRDGKRSRWRL